MVVFDDTVSDEEFSSSVSTSVAESDTACEAGSSEVELDGKVSFDSPVALDVSELDSGRSALDSPEFIPLSDQNKHIVTAILNNAEGQLQGAFVILGPKNWNAVVHQVVAGTMENGMDLHLILYDVLCTMSTMSVCPLRSYGLSG